MPRPSAHSTQTIAPQHSQLTSTPRTIYERPAPNEICAKLHTRRRDGHDQDIPLILDFPLVIGRNPAVCSYVIDELVVSNVHCKIQVVQSDDGGLIVSCEDVSTNGLLLNGSKIRKTAILLMDGDLLEIPQAQSFRCTYLFDCPPRQKVHLFDSLSQRNNTRHIHEFTVLPHCLGKGAFAEVHLALWPKKHMQVACKTIKVKGRRAQRVALSATTDGSKRARQPSEWDRMFKERDILMGLSHPNVIRVFAAVPDYDNNFLHIFLQLCTGGDLFSYLINHRESHGRLGEGETKYLMYQMFQALSYLHGLGIAHRDLKPENILLYTPGPFPRILIADFGLARPQSLEETFTVCGTVAYLPPEAVIALEDRSMGYFGLPGDCWSAGVLMFIMMAGYHPFDRHLTTWDTYHAVYGRDTFYIRNQPYYSQLLDSALPLQHDDDVTKWRIRNGIEDIDFYADVWTSLDDGGFTKQMISPVFQAVAKPIIAKYLIRGLLTEDPDERFTVSDALECRWIQQDQQELEIAYRRMASSARL